MTEEWQAALNELLPVDGDAREVCQHLTDPINREQFDQLVAMYAEDPITVEHILIFVYRSQRGAAALVDRLLTHLKVAAKRHAAGEAEETPSGRVTVDDVLGTMELLDNVDLADLLADLVAYFRRYVWFPIEPHQPLACALFAIHTWAIDYAEMSPRLAIQAPTMECGKSRLRECVEWVSFRGLNTVNITPPYLFRSLADGPLTIVIDEVDGIVGRRGKDADPAMVSLLNAGFERGAVVPRQDPPDFKTRYYPVFAPVVMAGIGQLPPTTQSRSIVIGLQRKLPSAGIKRIRRRMVKTKVADPLAQRIASWVKLYGESIPQGLEDDELPAALSDRQQDIWEPLLILADMAGKEWGEAAREAAVALYGHGRTVDEDSALDLLAAMKGILESQGKDYIGSSDLIKALKSDADSDWRHWHRGDGIRPTDVAKMLAGFGIKSHSINDGNGGYFRGYRKGLAAAFDRYLTNTESEEEEEEKTDSHPGDSKTGVTPSPQVSDYDDDDVTKW